MQKVENLDWPALLPIDMVVDINKIDNHILSQLDVRRILSRFRNRNYLHYLMFKFLLVTGVSLPELLTAKVHNLKQDCQYLDLPVRGRLYRRKIYLEKNFSLELHRFIAGKRDDEPLFPGRNGQRDNRSVQKILQKASSYVAKQLSVPLLRDLLALHFFRQGFPIGEIQEFLGHRATRSTRQRILLHSREKEKNDPRLFVLLRERVA